MNLFFLPSRQPLKNQFAAVGKPSQWTACLLFDYFWFWIESCDCFESSILMVCLRACGRVGNLKTCGTCVEHPLYFISPIPAMIKNSQSFVRSSTSSLDQQGLWYNLRVKNTWLRANSKHFNIQRNTEGVFCPTPLACKCFVSLSFI